MNSWSKDERTILLSKNTSGYIYDYNPKTGKFDNFQSRSDHFVEAVRNYIKRLYGKIKEVGTIKFGAIGVRKLDLGMGDDDNVVESVQAKEIINQVNEAGVSSQAVVMFASMGSRLLDL